MSKITQVQYDNKTGRAIIYVDYRFCAAIRQNVWDEMNLHEGSEISCARLRQKEAMVWRKFRKSSGIYPIKQAMTRIVQWFTKYLPHLEARIIDFSFDHSSEKSSLDYPSARNDQNIGVFLKGTSTEIITLEVAVAEMQRGTNYWVRSDKVTYAQGQSQKDAWVVLYCKHPTERLTWIKPGNKEYKHEELVGITNIHFVTFDDRSQEVYSSKNFCDYIQKKIDNMVPDSSSRVSNYSSTICTNDPDTNNQSKSD